MTQSGHQSDVQRSLNPHRGLSQYRFEPLRYLVLSLGAAMRRRDFVKAIITSAAGWPLLARARQPTTPVSPVLGQPAVDAFMAEELFWVAHPEQLLSFSGTLNPATQKLMKGGSEVPYQVDGSKIIVRAEGGIAANSSQRLVDSIWCPLRICAGQGD